MSGLNVPEEESSAKLFSKVENGPFTALKPNAETVKKVHHDLERRLGPRKIKSQLDLSEIQQVAEIVDELLEKRRVIESMAMVSSAESRVAPAPPPPPPVAQKRQQLYQQQPTQLSIQRNGSVQSEDNLRGIYTLPSTDAEVRRGNETGEDPFQKPPTFPESKFYTGKFVANMLVVIQVVIILIFAIFVSYEEENVGAVNNDMNNKMVTTRRPDYDNSFYSPSRNDRPSYNEEGRYGSRPQNQPVVDDGRQNLHQFYYFFQDVHVMIFIGFGFLMTFLRKYGYSAVSYNMLIAAIAIQWSIICRGIFHHNESGLIPVDITTLINGDFAAAAVLITFGAVLGVTSPFQLVSICLIEVFLYALNEFIGTELLKAIDVGGSMFIHTFGAYFGLALSLVLRKNSESESKNEGASYTSDIFAMIGTVFLWMFWPSFNGAMAEGDDQHRAVINTVLSLTASCICTFAISALVSAENKFNMVHIQNATLAGGVAVGAVADLMIRPYGALIIGSLAGLLSTVGYTYITPFLQSKLNLHDTCGVNNLHGMPGIMSGLAGAVMAVIASESEYGIGLYKQYPAMAPEMNSSQLNELRKDLTSIEPGDGRTAGQQALYQLLALGVTLCIAIIGGAVTGLIMRLPLFGQVPDAHLFDDSKLWEVPEEDENTAENRKGETNQSFEMKSGTLASRTAAIMEMDAGIAKGYAQLDEGFGTRRRNVEGCNNDDPAVYDELQRLRGLVEVIEGGDRTKGCLKLSLNNSAMSTIFGLVFMVIVTVTIYAFVNLYRALSKRFFQSD